VRARQLPDLTVPNMAGPDGKAPGFLEAFLEWRDTPPASWDDAQWLRDQWDGPFMIKGVMREDDARRAVAVGATAISVSNHGGNNLDGTPPILVKPRAIFRRASSSAARNAGIQIVGTLVVRVRRVGSPSNACSHVILRTARAALVAHEGLPSSERGWPIRVEGQRSTGLLRHRLCVFSGI
jgi:hypothetical protein